MGFSRFWEVKVVIFGHFGSPGAPFGGVFSWRGSISKIFWFFVILGALRHEKVVPF